MSALAAAGIEIDPLDPAVRVVDISRSHRVHRVLVGDGPGFVVKARDGSADGSRSLNNELYVYRVASWSERLAEVVPRPLLIDERRQVLVFETAVQEHGFEELLVRGSTPGAPMVRALGRAIGIWQGSTSDVPFPSAGGAGVMHLPETKPEQWTIKTPTARRLAGELLSDDVLCGALRDAAAAWVPAGLVHADLKWDNCLFDETSRPPAVRVIDWEMAGLGDPAWDLGCVLAEQVGLALHRHPAPDRSGLSAAVVAAGPLAEGLASEMRQADSEMWSRTARYVAVRLMHLALECAEFVGEPSRGQTAGLLRAATDLVAGCAELEAALVEGAGG